MSIVCTPNGWRSAPMPDPEAFELARQHRGAKVFPYEPPQRRHVRDYQSPRYPRNLYGETPEELRARIEKEAWG